MSSNTLTEIAAIITLEDVAKAAGVHPATVSRALRGVSGKVSPDKRAEIVRIARELGYQPNAMAASLRTNQTNLAAIVLPDLANPLIGPMVQGLERALRRHRMLCLVVQASPEPSERRELVLTLAASRVSGLLVLAAENGDPMLQVARQRRLPTVLVNRGAGNRHFSSVVNDDNESVRLVLEHLTDLGHRSIAHIAGPAASSTGQARREAFSRQTASIGLRQCRVIEASVFTREAGRVAAETLLARDRVSTAIFAANDLLALGVLDALKARGLRVPKDISLVGHNDMPLMDLIDPPLTTIHVELEQMSLQAASLFIEHLSNAELLPSTRVLMPKLCIRGSTGAPRVTNAR